MDFAIDNVLIPLVKIGVVFGALSGVIAYLTLLERKVIAFMQVRLGPMRVGPHGLLQPIADGLKLMLKEDIVPNRADRWIFTLAPVITLVPAFIVFAVIPFGPTIDIFGRKVGLFITDINIGALYVMAISSIGILGIILGGWASNSKYPLLGALRSAAQMVSYEVALGFSIMGVLMMSGTLSLVGIVEAQRDSHYWYVFLQPLGFILFFICGVAETNRAPFDLPEAESELTAGFHTEYSGFRWSLFFLAEYSAMIAVSSIAVTLWLGGWLRPFPNLLQRPAWDLAFSLVPGLTFVFLGGMCFYNTARMPKHPLFKIQTIGLAGFGAVLFLVGLIMFLPPVRDRVGDIFWFSAKVAGFMYLYIWYRGTFPRYRFDQLMKVGWKVLLPTGLGLLIVTAIWAMRSQVWADVIIPMWTAFVGWLRGIL